MEDLSKLSPFELKNYLIEVAKDAHGSLMLNAGRGNPNFIATIPREGYYKLGQFALQESEKTFSYLSVGLGGFPNKAGITERLYSYLDDSVGSQFIRKSVSYVRDQLGIDADDFVYEMSESILGMMYPDPDRMLVNSEKIVKKYIEKEMGNPNKPFDLFAVEGGTAAMAYIFETLEQNFILKKGDKIALGAPIFTPYIEIPKLREYDMVEINVEADEENSWQFADSELEKLLDPEIKAFFLVNPSNPPSVKMSDEKLAKLAEIIEKRPDLIVLTDDVYGTFADDFSSIFSVSPKNTILVYSYSKYFGSTGWRLGVIGLAEDNILDDMLQKQTKDQKEALIERYSSIAAKPEEIKFIDRFVAESRIVALNHTAGLATPAQVQMVLFSLFSLIDTEDIYKNAVKSLIRHRKNALYNELNVSQPDDENSVDYYNLIEVKEIAGAVYGEDFAAWVEANKDPDQGLFELAKGSGTVLLPANGFGTTDPGFRVSLANLNEYDYVKIADAVKNLLAKYYEEFKKS
ncbi:MAG: bifunctional aspartate transaminase/aspartate 4-decarboxylase [Lactobacillales bacterium]|jgi:aspartate 4-decarboxylase|nr:bifunctional aspartate transaminase/aspartate 4-decarboxylase [Lactobacillales bacterium]